MDAKSSNVLKACELGDWTPWTPCDRPCGSGVRVHCVFYVISNGSAVLITSSEQKASSSLSTSATLGPRWIDEWSAITPASCWPPTQQICEKR